MKTSLTLAILLGLSWMFFIGYFCYITDVRQDWYSYIPSRYELQQGLAAKGYYKDKIDWKIGPNTIAAWKMNENITGQVFGAK